MHQRAGDLGNILERVLLLTGRLTMNDNFYLSIENSGLSLALSGTHVSFDLSSWPITGFHCGFRWEYTPTRSYQDLPQVYPPTPWCWELPFPFSLPSLVGSFLVCEYVCKPSPCITVWASVGYGFSTSPGTTDGLLVCEQTQTL